MRKLRFGILILVTVFALVSVASALPPSLTIDHIVKPYGPVAYFNLHTTNGDIELPVGWMPGMCMGYYISGTKPELGDVWVTWDTRIAHTYPTYVGTIDWYRVNWIANNEFDDHDASTTNDWMITQAALWRLDGASGTTHPVGTYVYGYDTTKFDDYWANGVMSAEAGSFVPVEGQYYVALLTKDDGKGDAAQPMLIKVPIPGTPSPEFPSIALPVAMLIGMIGVVEYVRTKKE